MALVTEMSLPSLTLGAGRSVASPALFWVRDNGAPLSPKKCPWDTSPHSNAASGRSQCIYLTPLIHWPFCKVPTMGAAGTTPTFLPRAVHWHRVTAPPPASLSARGCGLFLQEQRRC